MKRKIIFLAMLLGMIGLFAIQGCKKVSEPVPVLYQAAMPASPAPAVNEVLAFTGSGQTIDLTWAATATNAPLWDVYFGKSSSPALVASGVSGNKYTATITSGGVFYWHVVTMDALGVQSPDVQTVWTFDVNSNPNPPKTPKPDSAKINVSCTPTITWVGTDPQSDALTYDIFMGKTAPPALTAGGLTSASYAPSSPLAEFTTYYWKVVAHDPYGGVDTSNLWKFTTGSLPIKVFTGAYTVDEPAEAWTYPVNLSFKSTTTVNIDQYWASWPAVFTIDLTNKTYSMAYTSFPSGYAGIESGIINTTTAKLQGTYTIWHNGTVIEQGVHTYTHN
jgi:hypothetical protein